MSRLFLCILIAIDSVSAWGGQDGAALRDGRRGGGSYSNTTPPIGGFQIALIIGAALGTVILATIVGLTWYSVGSRNKRESQISSLSSENKLSS